MTEAPSRTMPATLLAGAAAVLVVPGGIWWTRAAPREPPTVPPRSDGSVVVLQLDDGAAVSYDGGRTAITDPASQFALLQTLVDAGWPCRVPRRAPAPRIGGMGGPDRRILIPDAVPGTVVRLPRCTGLDGAATLGPAR
ncbi:hypothetical protein [Krasilnikovia sp. MM14-A1259]|uniref:hypothetical protein n=1 Tax=Krasilnikovia sp. MM14-A1259 TaxID=3373539 RepID=UPI00381B8FF0